LLIKRRCFAVLLLLLLVPGCLDTTSRVDSVTVANPLPYELVVHVSDGEGGEWTPLGIVQAGGELTVREVIDQGERWTFRFQHWGDTVGESTESRADLEGEGWRIEVPPSIGDRLEELGRPPST
jgi:hypothetical protein